MIGQEGATGWCGWFLGMGTRQNASAGEAADREGEEEAEGGGGGGGWTGWQDLAELPGVKEFQKMGVNFSLLRREDQEMVEKEGEKGDEEEGDKQDDDIMGE